MKIIKILHSICFSNICLILRVAITASSFFCIARVQCLKGQSDYLLTLCLYSGAGGGVLWEYFLVLKSLYWVSPVEGMAYTTAVSTKLQMGITVLFFKNIFNDNS